MTPGTARFLLDLLMQQQLSAGHPDLIAVATQVASARTELETMLGDPP